jgi:DNA-binding protein HU-beta
MKKTELTKMVAEKAELTQKEAAAATQAVLNAITNALANEEKVQILGFGTFEVRERSARTGRNPQTGEEMQIAASMAPAFKAGKELKEAVK